MPRPPAADRIPELLRTAGNVFLAKGYRRTQMADVSAAMGLSAGAVYRYVASKEALFDLVLRFEADRDGFRMPEELPLPTPPEGATLAFLAEVLTRETSLPHLREALATEDPEDTATEVAGIARDLVRALARRHRGLKILERSALDWPELAEIWWGTTRDAVVTALAGYVERRMARGHFHPLPDTAAAARVFTEVSAYFGIHRHYDPEPTPMSEEVAEETAVAVLVRTFARENRHGN